MPPVNVTQARAKKSWGELSNHARAQLEAIRDFESVRLDRKIDASLGGGWAVDFQLGHCSRPHSDIDYLVAEKSLPLLIEGLVAVGFRQFTDTGGWETLLRRYQHITLLPTRVQSDGTTFIDGSWAPTEWNYRQYPSKRRQLMGIEARVLHPALLLRQKHATPAKLGQWRAEKDAHDITILERLRAEAG